MNIIQKHEKYLPIKDNNTKYTFKDAITKNGHSQLLSDVVKLTFLQHHIYYIKAVYSK